MPNRDSFAGFPPSPVRKVYCKLTDDVVVLPLDVCILADDESELATPLSTLPSGVFIGANIMASGGGLLGSIPDGGYEWPPALPTDVNPVVMVQRAANASFANAPLNSPIASHVPVGTPVRLSTGESGTVTEAAAGNRPYPEAGSEVTAYKVHFDDAVSQLQCGSRVQVGSGPQLLGMLIAVDDNGDALVYPAGLIHI
jgi:hypothetical protein